LALWQGKSRRKPSGGRLISSRNKRKTEIGSDAAHTLIGKVNRKLYRKTGGGKKIRVMSEAEANVYNPETKKTAKSKILTVKANAANPHFVQRNIITKGALLQTELGLARVTSRPGQDGIVNAVLEQKQE
jgi:small subunit ribosomal protein S8e